jgi:hypothetical protein
MLNSEKDKYQSGLRFRRWTRKAYAVFSSLGKEVTIGKLSMSMVPVALLKLKSVVNPFIVEDFQEVDKQEDIESAENIVLIPGLITIINVKSGEVNPFENNLLTKTVGMVS